MKLSIEDTRLLMLPQSPDVKKAYEGIGKANTRLLHAVLAFLIDISLLDFE
jgi:hypothetical protein